MRKLKVKNEFLTWPNMALANIGFKDPIWSHFGDQNREREKSKMKKRKKRRGRGRREEEEGGTKIKGMELLNLSMDLWFA